MQQAGMAIPKFNGLFISHDHSDHARSAGIFQRKMQMPLFITPKTFHQVEPFLGKLNQVEHFYAGDTVQINHVFVHTMRTPHDGVDPSVFIIDDGHTRVGLFTDLGNPFPQLKEQLDSVDVLFLESNYQETWLQANPNYPERLKRRIRGMGGHLENEESAILIRDYTTDRLKHVYLSHLSEQNNSPEISLEIHRQIYGMSRAFELHVAPRHCVSNIVQVDS